MISIVFSNVLLSVIIKEWVWIAMEIHVVIRHSSFVICYLLAPRKAALPPRGSTPCEKSDFTGLFVICEMSARGESHQRRVCRLLPARGGSALGMTRFENKTTAWGLLNSFVMYDHA
jgi:hypothetical protein